MDLQNYFPDTNSDEYTEFINIYCYDLNYQQKANNKRLLKKYYKERKITNMLKAFQLYLYFKRNKPSQNNNNHINDIKTPPEDAPNKNINHNNDIKTPETKPEKSLIQKGKEQLNTIQWIISQERLKKLTYPDEFNNINNENLSKEELKIIAEKILKWNIYKNKYRDA
jgi:hypothetical protein